MNDTAPEPVSASDSSGRLRGDIEVVGRRVLVVDDNEDAGVLMGDMLRAVGHEVVVSPDGPSALDAIARFVPDVAILDIGLPYMDGYELAAALRRRLGSGLRLMALTGYGQEQDRVKSHAAGFEAHFVKPVSLGTIITAIEVGARRDPA